MRKGPDGWDTADATSQDVHGLPAGKGTRRKARAGWGRKGKPVSPDFFGLRLWKSCPICLNAALLGAPLPGVVITNHSHACRATDPASVETESETFCDDDLARAVL